MNFKGIFVVCVIAAIIVTVVLLPNNIRNNAPRLEDQPVINDTVSLNSDLQNKDEPKLEDYTTAEKSSDIDYYIDENGSKHHIIKVNDTIDISE